MNTNTLSQYSTSNFKRKRKSIIQKNDNETDKSRNYKRLIMEDDFDSISDSSSSNTQQYIPFFEHNIKMEEQFSLNDYLSSDDSVRSEMKIEPYSSVQGFTPIKSEYVNINRDFIDSDTFCVDMGRFENFTTSSKSRLTNLKTEFLEFDAPSLKIEPSSSPVTTKNSRRNRNHIYKPHRHNKTVTVPQVPCKGPACKSQICCAQYCSQSCFTNQMRPIGTSGLRNHKTDYDIVCQQDNEVTDYGLPYVDHTYCYHHKNVYFSSDLDVDSPPYCALVDRLFYEEQEQRIKNPRPEPNINGDPISSNGCVSQTTKRGRPKRTDVIGLLDAYIFHPSTDVVYKPFVFRENVIEASRQSIELRSERPLIQAIRQCSGLYRDARTDVPPEVFYASVVETNYDKLSLTPIKGEATVRSHSTSAIDDLFD